MLKNIIFFSIVYIGTYSIHIALDYILFTIDIRPSYIFDGYPYILLGILIFSTGYYNIKNQYSLLLLFIVILFLGLIHFNFYIDYMDACSICGLNDNLCTHDCDGRCYGWYTFENEKSWLFFSYTIWWGIFSSIFLIIKKVFTKRVK
ncbi:MAG TPA: hypothetical protein EYG80_06135 [Flavobacteriaceae bacterium]|nr:hypothetical protein [Flavobacteriaceae bacterium]